MTCQNCQHPNEAIAKFCTECGTKLKRSCNKCGTEYSAEAKFCAECGNNLTATVLPSVVVDDNNTITDREIQSTAPAQRRQLTVMFCDIVGSTQLSDHLDAEDYRQVILNYQEVAEKVVNRYGGHVAQYLGDGLLIYFGYPNGLEEAPREGVRCALGILEALVFANKEWAKKKETTIDIRIGIHTGLVVVDKQLALGDTTNIAARLESLANPNTVVISDQTYKLTEGWFETKSTGYHQLKGIAQSMEVFEVIHESGARTRMDIAMSKGLSPLIGREGELDLLLRGWQNAQNNKGSLVLLTGEAGIGKSRLVTSLKQKVAEVPNAWLTEARCSSYHQNTAYYPLIDLLERVVLQFEREDTTDEKLVKLEGYLLQSGLTLELALPLFCELLSLPCPEQYAKSNLSPSGNKKKTLEVILQALLNRASQQPVLLVIEDLHWADPTTLEWVYLLLEQLPTHPILAVFTARPDFEIGKMREHRMTQLTLQRLSPNKIESICRHLCKGKKLPLEVLLQIQEKTDGVPLFIEELTRMILDSGMLVGKEDHYELQGALPNLSIPTTLQDSLVARLDRLNAVKELMQIGAVLGRTFSYELIKAVANKDEEVLQNSLDQLVKTEMLFQRGVVPNATFVFRHALIQDAAYETLLKSHRQKLHQKVASVLQQQVQSTMGNEPEVLAHHLTEAKQIVAAVDQWKYTGYMALQRHANREGVNHLKKGLSLIPQIKEEVLRSQKTCELLSILAPSMQLLVGYANPEIEDLMIQWIKAAEQTGELNKLHDAKIGQYVYHAFSASYNKSALIENEIIPLGEERGDQFLLATSIFFAGIHHCLKGQYASANEYYNRALILYNPTEHKHKSYYHTGNIKVNILTYNSTVLHLLGYPDQALKSIQTAYELVSESTKAGSFYANAAFYARVFKMRKEYDKIEAIVKPALGIAIENGDTFITALLSYYLHVGYAHLGSMESAQKALHIMTQIYQVYKAFQPAFMVFIVDAFRKLGAIEKGMEVVNTVLTHVQKTGEGLFAPEAYRLKALLLIAQKADDDLVLEYFQTALDLAKEHGDLWHEMLVLKDLAKLAKEPDEKQSAYQALKQVYAKFSEGFDTKDLVETQMLLQDWEGALVGE